VPPEDLPVMEFAFPGPLRDQLVAAVLDGSKTTTTSLLTEYERAGEAPPAAGRRHAVADSAGHLVALIETTAVRVGQVEQRRPAERAALAAGHGGVSGQQAPQRGGVGRRGIA
jgi:uncharacterized protein YhfF